MRDKAEVLDTVIEAIGEFRASKVYEMSALPVDRLQPFIRPFSYSGVDYCGPFNVSIRRAKEKRWISLFTYMSVRAVHLKVSKNLSSDSFLLCLRNFMNRRGVPA